MVLRWTNPVDISYATWKFAGLPQNRIIGIQVLLVWRYSRQAIARTTGEICKFIWLHFDVKTGTQIPYVTANISWSSNYDGIR